MALPPLSCACSLCQLPALWREGRVGGPCVSGDALRAVPQGRAGCGPCGLRSLLGSPALGHAQLPGLCSEQTPCQDESAGVAGVAGGAGQPQVHGYWDLAGHLEVRGKRPSGVPGLRL